MTTAKERLANAIWHEISNPARIFTKGQVRSALIANGIGRAMATLFNDTEIRRLLEDKAAKKGRAVVIDRGCIFVTSEEYEILHAKVRRLRYLMTMAQSIGHEGTGNNVLLASADKVSRDMGQLAIDSGVFGAKLRRKMDKAEAALAIEFNAGRAAANAHFAAARARANAHTP